MTNFFRKIGNIFSRESSNNIDYKEMISIIKHTDNAKLIDVRSTQEYNESHLNNALCIPVFELKSEIEKIVKDKNNIIILYCASGVRSLKGKKILESMGYKNVYNLKGGIDNI